MSDDTMKVDIGLEVHSTGEELIDALTRKLDALNRKIKSIASASAAIGRSVSSPGGSSTSTNGNAASKSARDALGVDRASVAELKRKLTVTSRMASQRQREERAAFADFRSRMSFKMKADAADMRAVRDKAQEEARAFRQRMSFTSRMARRAITEERAAARERARSIADAAREDARRSREMAASIRENARLEAAENRRVDRERSSRESDRRRGYASVRQGAGDMREGAGRAVRGAGAVSAVAATGTGAVVRRGVSTRLEVDTAETNLKIFSAQTADQIKQARRGFLYNESIRYGLGIAGGLNAYSEVLKTGMKAPEANVKTIMQAVSALELDLKDTTKLAGLIDRNYGAASDPARIKSALNAVAVAAREDPTQSNEIVEGVKRSFGALSTGNLTPEQLTAMVSGGQSVGIQPGKAGTFVATMAKQLSMGSSKFLGKKNRSELDFAARELGLGNARSMAQTYAKDSYATMMSVHERLAAMEASKRTQVAEALYGRQWSDEGLQMAQGAGGVRKTFGEITDGRNSNFLEEAARQRAESLAGQWNSTRSILQRFWDSFGAGFEDILTSFNSYFLDLNSSFDYAKVKGYVTEFVEGVREAFGVSTWRELFQKTFGGNIGNIGADIRAFGRGLADGILSIGRVIRSVMTVFGGAGGGAETIGRLSGQFVALSLALVAIGPFVGILGGLASIIAGLAVAGRGLAGLAGLGAGAAGMGAAGAFRGIGLLLSKAFGLAVVAEIGANRGTISTWMLDGAKALLSAVMDGIKSVFSAESIQAAMRAVVAEMIPAPLQRWMESNGQEEKKSLPGKVLDGLGKPPVQVAPSERGVLGKAWDWITESLIGSAKASEMEGRPPGPGANQLADALEENSTILRQSFSSPLKGFDGLIHKASISGTGSAQAVRASILDTASGVRSASVGSPVLSGITASGGFGLGPLAGSISGSALNGGSGLSRRGIIGGGLGVPGAGGGSASSNPANSAASARMLDAIAGTESGRAGYDAVLGNGKYGTPSKPVSSMTMDEAFAFGRQIKARHGSSSALGRYQIVGNTMRAAQKALGIPGDATFNVENQDRMARWIARSQGLGAWEGLKHNPRAMAAARAAMSEGGASDAPSRSASLGAGIPGLGGAGQYDGLRVKGAQAYAGGSSYQGVTDLARQVQANLPGGVKHFSAFNDKYHQGTRSKHASGLAFDTTLIDAARSSEAAEAIRSKIRAAGITDDAFKVIDEYRNPSVRSTGGHLHTQFNTAEAAKNYSDYIARLRGGSGGDLAAKAEAIKSSGWKPGAGGNAGALGAETSVPLGRDAPMRVQNTQPIGGSSGGAGGSASSTTNTIHINGAGQDAESIANAVQRKLNDKINRRTTDFSPSTLSV